MTNVLFNYWMYLLLKCQCIYRIPVGEWIWLELLGLPYDELQPVLPCCRGDNWKLGHKILYTPMDMRDIARKTCLCISFCHCFFAFPSFWLGRIKSVLEKRGRRK